MATSISEEHLIRFDYADVVCQDSEVLEQSA